MTPPDPPHPDPPPPDPPPPPGPSHGRTAEDFRPGQPAAGSDYGDPAGVGAEPSVEDALADEPDAGPPGNDAGGAAR